MQSCFTNVLQSAETGRKEKYVEVETDFLRVSNRTAKLKLATTFSTVALVSISHYYSPIKPSIEHSEQGEDKD